MNGPAGLKSIRMRRNSTHRVHGYRPANHFIMCLALEIGPGLVNYNLFIKGDAGQLSCNCLNLRSRYASYLCNRIRGIGFIHVGFCHLHEDRYGLATFFRFDKTFKVRLDTLFIDCSDCTGFLLNHLRCAVLIAQEQPMLITVRIVNHQPGRICVADQIIQIDFTSCEKLMNKGQNK